MTPPSGVLITTLESFKEGAGIEERGLVVMTQPEVPKVTCVAPATRDNEGPSHVMPAVGSHVVVEWCYGKTHTGVVLQVDLREKVLLKSGKPMMMAGFMLSWEVDSENIFIPLTGDWKQIA